jgi:hypothetical protein
MTAHLSEPGHRCLSNGDALRVDPDRWFYRARWFVAPSMSMMCSACGPLAQMLSAANGWIDAYDASVASPALVGDGSGAVPSLAAPDQQLGEIA